MAILKHEIPETEYYELEPSKRDFQVGDSLTAVGYPDIYLGDKLNVRPGYITSLPTRSAVPMIEVTQKLTQGMSGGPVIDENNGVAGIIHKGGPNEGRDLAVHIKSLIEWLNEP